MSVRADILSNLETALNGLKNDTDYEVNLVQVSMYDERFLDASRSAFPWLMILDDQTEEKIAEDGSNVTYYMNLVVRCIIKADYRPNLVAELNTLQSAVKQFLYSSPSLGDHVLGVQYEGGDGLSYYADDGFGVVDINCRIIYWTTRGSF